MDLLANVKVYKANWLHSYIVPFPNLTTQRRCRNLITRCEILISGLREGDRVVPADHQAALDEAEGSVFPISVLFFMKSNRSLGSKNPREHSRQSASVDPAEHCKKFGNARRHPRRVGRI